MSFTVTQNKTLWGGEGPVLTLNSAVTFSSVLTNVGTAVMKINFFKKLYIQFAVDIPYVLLFVFIYDYQFNINIVSKKKLLMKMSMDVYSMSDFYPQRMNLIQNAFQLTYRALNILKV